MIFNFYSLLIKLLALVLIMLTVIQSGQTQYNIKHSLQIRNNMLANKFIDLRKEIKSINEDIKKSQLQHENVDQSNINYKLKSSNIYVKSEFDEINLSIDFDEFGGGAKLHKIDLNLLTKTYIKGAAAVDVQLTWCSQQTSGYLTMGINLAQIKNSDKNWEWTSINDFSNFEHNLFLMFTIYNDYTCKSFEDFIIISKDGSFFMYSEGKPFNSKSKSISDTELLSRHNTKIRMIIKGYQVVQTYPKFEL